MSRSTFFGIEIGKSGIQISQKALDLTGHNIANVDTIGYTRQRLVTTSVEPYAGIQQFQPIQRGRVGQGVDVKILDQIRDSFLDRQYRTENTIYNNWSTRTEGLGYIESLLEGDASADITTSLDNLLASFNDLADEPYDEAQRVVLQQRALQLIEDYKHTYDRLIEMQADQDLCVETVVGRINTISEELATLNKHIFMAELDGQPANDLRDKRNLLLDELSNYTDVTYYENAQGKMTVELGNNQRNGDHVLVDHVTINKLICQKEEAANPLADGDVATTNDQLNVVYWANADGTPNLDRSLPTEGGSLLAHAELMTSTDPDMPGIPYFIEKLNLMARALVQEVNRVHRQGYCHPSGTNGSMTGIDFFKVAKKTVTLETQVQHTDANGNPGYLLDNDTDFGTASFYVDADGYCIDGDGARLVNSAGNQLKMDHGALFLTDAASTPYSGTFTPVMVPITSTETVDDLAGITAGNLALSDLVKENEANIAASTEPVSFAIDETTGLPDPTKLKGGNNENGKALYEIYNNTNIKLNYYTDDTPAVAVTEDIGSLNGFLNGMVLDIATTLNYAKNKLSTQSALLLATDNSRLSISGVSLDEEMTNLIRYQHAYSGSSRVITAMDEALDTLINRMGLVGLR